LGWAQGHGPWGKQEPQDRAGRAWKAAADPRGSGHPILEAAEEVVTWAHEVDKVGEKVPEVPVIRDDGGAAAEPAA
jgi:hypothetical protein